MSGESYSASRLACPRSNHCIFSRFPSTSMRIRWCFLVSQVCDQVELGQTSTRSGRRSRTLRITRPISYSRREVGAGGSPDEDWASRLGPDAVVPEMLRAEPSQLIDNGM